MPGTARTRGAAMLAAAVLAGLFGCARQGQERRPVPEETGGVTTGLQEALTRRPDVVRARVVYQDNLSASARADVTVAVRAGTDFEPVVEEAVRLVWTSTLRPLRSINVAVVDDAHPARGTTRHLEPEQADRTALEERYGPRP